MRRTIDNLAPDCLGLSHFLTAVSLYFCLNVATAKGPTELGKLCGCVPGLPAWKTEPELEGET